MLIMMMMMITGTVMTAFGTRLHHVIWSSNFSLRLSASIGLICSHCVTTWCDTIWCCNAICVLWISAQVCAYTFICVFSSCWPTVSYCDPLLLPHCFFLFSPFSLIFGVGWWRDIVVSGVRRMSDVNAHRARLVLGWVGIQSRYVTNPTRSIQPCIPPRSLNRVPASAGVKVGMSPLSGGR